MESSKLPYLFLVLAVVLGGVFFWSSMGSSDTVISDDAAKSLGSTNGSASGTSVAPSKQPAPSTPKTPSRVFENGRWVTVVKYSSTGFDPKESVLNKGEEVRFLNTTTLTMRVSFSKVGAPPNDIPGISQDNSVGKNGTYQVTMLEPGIWNFYNLNGNKSLVGVLNVQ